jgi:hypothetical protein
MPCRVEFTNHDRDRRDMYTLMLWEYRWIYRTQIGFLPSFHSCSLSLLSTEFAKLFKALHLFPPSVTCFLYVLFPFSLYVWKTFGIPALCTLSRCFHFIWQYPMSSLSKLFLFLHFVTYQISRHSNICYLNPRFPFLCLAQKFYFITAFTLYLHFINQIFRTFRHKIVEAIYL